MNPQDPRIIFAADIFIREMKRQWMRQHPSSHPSECPVRILEEYPAQHRNALVNSVAKAIEASTGMNEVYATWLNLKTGSDQPS